MNTNTIPQRSEVPEEFTWNLNDIFPGGDEAWLAEYEALKACPAQLAAYAGRLGESAETLLAWFKLNDEIGLRLEKLYGYASCKGDQDTANAFYQDMRGKALSVLTAISSASAFDSGEILAIPDETLDRFYAEQQELEVYRRSIYRVRRRRAHILSSECEKLLASAGEMDEGPSNIYGMFHNADLRFPSVTDGEGVAHELSDGTFIPMLESADRTFRRNAFETYYKTLGGFKNTVAATLDALQAAQVLFRRPQVRNHALRRARPHGGARGGLSQSHRGRAPKS